MTSVLKWGSKKGGKPQFQGMSSWCDVPSSRLIAQFCGVQLSLNITQTLRLIFNFLYQRVEVERHGFIQLNLYSRVLLFTLSRYGLCDHRTMYHPKSVITFVFRED